MALGIASITLQPASAQMPGGATELTQLANEALLTKDLAGQASQIQNQLKELADMALNTTGLSTNNVWGTVVQDLNQLNSLLNQSKALAYTASNLDTQFANKYGTYTSYLTQNMGAKAWQQKYAQWSQDGSDNALYTLKDLNLQASQMQSDAALMQQLQGLAGSAQGRMQALQAANMIAAQNVDQIQKLRQLIMLQAQMQANYLAIQQDKEAARQAASEQFETSATGPFSAINGKWY
jgi:P-type conjugative transfer protein TrbJ